MNYIFKTTATIFQSTRPLRGATQDSIFAFTCQAYFNPRAPCGARRSKDNIFENNKEISIHAPLAGRDRTQLLRSVGGHVISIHAPLAGRDAAVLAHHLRVIDISIHAPLAGRDTRRQRATPLTLRFQSTRPLRGATQCGQLRHQLLQDFNPRAPCGARPRSLARMIIFLYFNPRAPCGARRHAVLRRPQWKHFNPRAPCGARPPRGRGPAARHNFNPRAPCGARQQTCTKNMYMFVRTDKRNSFPCRTLSVRAPDEKL